MVANELCWFLRDQNKFMCWKVVLHAINHWVVSTLVQSSFLNSEKIKRNPFIFQNKIRAMLKDKKVWMGKTTVVDCLLEQIALQFLIWSAIQTLRYNALSLSLKKLGFVYFACLFVRSLISSYMWCWLYYFDFEFGAIYFIKYQLYIKDVILEIISKSWNVLNCTV